MYVRIDKARQQRHIAEINHRCASRVIDGRANSLNPPTVNQNLSGPENVSRIDFEQSRCMQHDGRARWLLRVGTRRRSGKSNRCESQSQSELRLESLHGYDYAAVSPGLSMKNFCRICSPQYAPIPVRFCPRISV